MSSGSYTRGNFQYIPEIGWIGYQDYKQWSGGDRPASQNQKYVVREVVYFDPSGKKRTYRFRDYPKRQRTYLDGEHNYNVQYSRIHDVIGSFQRPTGGRQDVSARVAAGDPDYTRLWTDNDTIEVVNKLRNKVAGSDFNMAVAIAELPEALQTIAAAATRIDRALRALRRGQFGNAAHYLLRGRGESARNPRPTQKGLAGQWLELQYGWLPLLHDVKGASEFLAHHLNSPLVQVHRASKIMYYPQTIEPWRYAMFKSFESYQIKAILREQDVTKLLGLQDPASVLWEKLPYSFVIDWFIPVGNWLSARGLASSLSGTFVTTRRVHYEAGHLYGGGALDFQGFEGYRQSAGTMNRSVSSSLQIPLPTLKPLGEIASWKRAANAVALLVNRSWK